MNTTLNKTRMNPPVANPQAAPREFPLERLRNLGIAAHIDAGKTTLTERILYYTGAIHKVGEVHDGTTTTDFSDLEREKGITITAAAIPCDWTPADEAVLFKNFTGLRHRLNIIDTPGHVDFTAEVERSLRVLDGAVAVFSGVEGVQPQSETVWRQADKYGVPRIAFVNKMDRTGADFAHVVSDMRTKLGANAWPVLPPLGSEDQLRGQLDVVNERALVFANGKDGGYHIEEVSPELRDTVARMRRDLVAALAELDDAVAALFIENQPVPASVLKAAIRRQTMTNRFVPVIGGSAYKFKGVQPLIDAIVDYLPSPLDLPAIRSHGENEAEVLVHADDAEPLAALAFKVATDKQAGRLVYLRVYSGSLRKGDTVYVPRTGKRERIGRLLRLHANKREEIAACYAGDIAAIAGTKSITTGDTLCAVERPVLLEPPSFPEPVVSMAIEAESSTELEHLAIALQRLSDEDPTFHTFTDAETGQTIMAGMGELHLDIMRERLAREFKVATNTGQPQIAYRETITQAATGDYLLKKQSGGSGMFARVIVNVSPNERGKGIVIEDQVTGGNIPRPFIAACVKGANDALRDGVLGGYPVVDVCVVIVDGAAHVKDSNELAFRLAATYAVKEALRAAQPVLLEPIMKVESSVPAEYQGDILGDLKRRRGVVLGLETRLGTAIVTAEVPLAEMFGYANATRSLSKGRAAYSMQPSHFTPAPASAVSALLKPK